jgi:hypothetical protein
MVDTGAVCSVLPHHSTAQPAGPQLSGADGRSIPTWGTIRCRLSFVLRTFFVTFFLAAVYRPIPGLDFLSAQGLLADPVSRQVLDSTTLKPLSKTPTAAGTLRSKFAAALCSIAPSVRSLLATFPAIVGDGNRRNKKSATRPPTLRSRPPTPRSRPPTLRPHTAVPAAQIAATAAHITIPAAYIAAPAAHARPRPPTWRSEPPTTRLGPPTSRLLPPTSRTRPNTTPHRPQTRTTTAAHVALDIATVAAVPSPIAPMVAGPGSSTHASLVHSRLGSSHLHSRRAGDAPLRRGHRSERRRRNSGAAATGDLQPTSYSATNNYIHFFSIRPPASRRPTAEPTQPLSLPPQSLGGTCGAAPSVPTVFPASTVT